MEITITEAATDWYERELDVETGDALRFFVRYGGVGGRIPGFSLGIATEQPDSILTSTVVNGITYFIDTVDAWYFENNDLMIEFDEQLDEPQFTYKA